MSKATEKQIRYLLFLLREAGYATDWMCAQHAKLGATMRERQGRVEDWLRSMTIDRASALIERLKSEIQKNKQSVHHG